MRILAPLAALLALSALAAAQDPQADVVLAVEAPASSSLVPGEARQVEVAIQADLSNMVCTTPGEIVVQLSASGAVMLTATTVGDVAVPFAIGPVGSSPAGTPPGFPSQGTATTNITIAAPRTVSADATEPITITASYAGGLPAGCQAAQPAPPTQASDVHQASVNASLPAATGTSGPAVVADAEGPPKEAPASSLAALATALGLLARRLRP